MFGENFSKQKILILSVFVSCFGGSMLFGYNLAVINSPTKFIEDFYVKKSLESSTEKPTKSEIDFFIAVLSSSFVVTGLIGSFCSGYFANLWGRKICLLLNHIPMIIGSILEGVALPLNTPILLIIGRAIIGLSCGLTITIISMYLAEIASQDTRGAVGSCNQLSLSFGILLAQVLGLEEVFGTEKLWPLILASGGIVSFISGIVFIFCPESPRYLIVKGKIDAARSALSRLRGESNVDGEIEAMSEDKTEPMSFLQLFSTKSMYLSLGISFTIHMTLQWSGINSIFFYSERIFKAVDIAESNIGYAIVGTGVIMVLGTLIAIPLFERLGRRPLLLISILTMIISLSVLAVALDFITDQNKDGINLNVTNTNVSMTTLKPSTPGPGISAEGVLAFSMLLIYIGGFAIGVGPLTWPVSAELFRQDCRGPALAVSGAVNWLAFFAVGMSFPTLNNLMGPYVFLLFAGFLLAVGIFLFVKLPETKNKTFEEIASEMSNTNMGKNQPEAVSPIN